MYDIYLKTMLYEACMKYVFLIKEKKNKDTLKYLLILGKFEISRFFLKLYSPKFYFHELILRHAKLHDYISKQLLVVSEISKVLPSETK